MFMVMEVLFMAAMPYLLELLKIVSGALNADRPKVVSYVEQLAGRLEEAGDPVSARRLRRTLAEGKAKLMEMGPASVGTRLPVDSESRLDLADEERPTVDAVDLVLDSEHLEVLREFVGYVGAADRLLAEGVGISPSLLVFGPPGCGKTQLARFTAAQLGLPLLTARTDSLISSFLGSTAKNVRRLFEHAMSRPCVLFLDELDAIAKLRDDQHEMGELKRVVISLLQNIDALDQSTVLIGATNHEHLLDPAIWRRFAYHLKIGLPKEGGRRQLFQLFLSRHATQDVVILAASVAEGLTGSDIRQVSEDSIRAAIVHGNETIDECDVLRRILRLRLPEWGARGENMPELVRRVREMNPDVFTYRRLAALFGVSLGHVSKLIHQRERGDGKGH
ncbi:MAG: ATP-binding protein [Deltaproteobacteria bacterium]|nr:ATP-binding protein [Deltaproteobacteria bacterium]